MKIGIDGREFKKGKITGISRYLLGFLHYAAVQNPKNQYIVFQNQYTEINFSSFKLKKVLIPECLTLWWDQVQLPYHLKKEKIDIFLSPYFKAPLFSGCKLVVIINDLIPLMIPECQNLGEFFKRVYFKHLGKRTAKKADKIITISGYSKKDIIKVFGISEAKIEVIKLSADESYRPLKSGRQEVISKYGIGGKYIFYLGNFSPHKNVKTLIEAYEKLPLAIKDGYKLALGGKKDRDYCRLFKLVKNLKLENNVIFTDYISEKDLPYLYNAASLFVFPSLYEGFGLPVLEAMACGISVIASNAASLPEVVGDAGILINPYDSGKLSEKIYAVLTNKPLQEDLSNRALNRAKCFSFGKTSKQISNALEKV